MARKSSQSTRGRKSSGRTTRSNRSSESRTFDLRRFNNTDIQKIMKKVRSNPIALSLVGGVGALFLGRFAFRYYRNHPEIKEFIKDNFDMVEETLRDYRSGGSAEDVTESRH